MWIQGAGIVGDAVHIAAVAAGMRADFHTVRTAVAAVVAAALAVAVVVAAPAVAAVVAVLLLEAYLRGMRI